ncbi:RWD domain protein [Onchocerca flexuosa]|uniref:RBR-type E3 ubiquitin transferase n=1 Tax=Onchocerca flexuosa TaxID=387005 RepID=A0A238BSL5_9BILA|nr:RWD domain protein [Onchocerca flexuosa]
MDVACNADRKDQLNEVQALESIYSDTPEWFSYNIGSDSQITGCITVVLSKIENGIAVHAGGKIVHIHHIPPLLLCFTFPQDYPSHSMPLFSLHASWLDSIARHRLTEILVDSWTNYLGMPILFTWCELLKEEAMQIVLSQTNIDLNKIISEENEASTIRKESTELLEIFVDFNDRATRNDFESKWYDCEVCFSSKSGKECVRFMPCGHVFCMECISDYYRQKLHDNLIWQFQCLNTGCDSPATQTQIRQVLNDDEFEVYEQRLLEGALDLMSDVVTCPRISCQAPVIIDNSEHSNLASCSLCHYSFCILCKKTYHGVESCSLTEEFQRKLMSQIETATPTQLEEIYRKFGKKQLEQLLETLKSEKWIQCNSKPCPSCQAKIEKGSGCNKITCIKCGHCFCWLCGIVLNKNDPYSHFNTRGSCYNRLFEGVDEEDWFA